MTRCVRVHAGVSAACVGARVIYYRSACLLKMPLPIHPQTHKNRDRLVHHPAETLDARAPVQRALEPGDIFP